MQEANPAPTRSERAVALTSALVRRIVITLVIMLVMSFVVAWLLETAPVVAYVLGVLSLAFLARTLWKALRSERPAVALAAIAGSFLLGALLAFAIDAAIGSNPEPVQATSGEVER